jgi:hypothetical protein
MVRVVTRTISMWCALLLVGSLTPAQQPAQSRLLESGEVVVSGHSVPYRIRRLPVSSFPDLPAAVAGLLNQRACMIPQTYEAHRPENVVHASLERAGSSDWAVLCSGEGTVSLLVFFGSATGDPMVLSTSLETQRLQGHDDTGILGFNWGIDPASPDRVRDAQTAMEHRPRRLDHDALADSVVDHRTIYHFYAKNVWTLLEMPK